MLYNNRTKHHWRVNVLSEEKNTKEQNIYDDNSIKVLKGIGGIRKNPSMYVGDDGIRGLHHIVYEVLDNCIDEFMAGYCSEIFLTIENDGSIKIEDNGRGFPVGIHPKEKKPTIEVILTTLHAGGKFDNYTYKVSGGLHGVGISCTNALSEWLEITTFRNKKTYGMLFEKGEPKSQLKEKGGLREKKLGGETGTIIHFKPDNEIFSTITIDANTIKERLTQISFLNQGIKIFFEDKNNKEKETLYSKDGITGYLKELNENNNELHSQPFYMKEVEKDGEDEVIIEISMQYFEQDINNVYSFANNIKTIDGGTHVTGFRKAITRVLNQYAIEKDKIDKEERFSGTDVREGLSAIISIYLPNPKFEGQTKTKLTNVNIDGIISSSFGDSFKVWLEEHPSVAERIMKRALSSYNARLAAKKAASLAKKKASLDGAGMPSKLKNCSSKYPEKRELFIVEGNSAGGNAEMARNSEYQAILPLRGKVINTEKSKIEKILKNNEIVSLIKAIGTGITTNGNEEDFDIKKLKFNKIIITTDADVDGSHIKVLLLNFFFRYMKPLLVHGHIWLAEPPLYKITVNKEVDWNNKKSKQFFINSDNELKKFMDKYKNKIIKNGIQRFKGLGELNAEQLAETTMDKKTRNIVQVKLQDINEADELFDILFGSDVQSRYNYIQEHSELKYDIDI